MFRTAFVLFAVLCGAGVGALFSMYWAAGLGLFQFGVTMLLTKRIVRLPESEVIDTPSLALET